MFSELGYCKTLSVKPKTKTMITLEPIPQPVRIKANVNAENLALLIGAIAASGVVPADLGGGKTLADIANLSLNVLPTALPDGTVAVISAMVK